MVSPQLCPLLSALADKSACLVPQTLERKLQRGKGFCIYSFNQRTHTYGSLTEWLSLSRQLLDLIRLSCVNGVRENKSKLFFKVSLARNSLDGIL